MNKSIIDELLAKAKGDVKPRQMSNKQIDEELAAAWKTEKKPKAGVMAEDERRAKQVERSSRKSEETSLCKSIDALIEKAVIGAGARAGKIEQGTHKDTPAHGKVSRPAITPEMQAKYAHLSEKEKNKIKGSVHGAPKTVEKIVGKSLDERTCDYLEKSDAYPKGKPGELDAEGNMIRTPDLRPKHKKEVKANPVEVDREHLGAPDYQKSLDDRTIDYNEYLEKTSSVALPGREEKNITPKSEAKTIREKVAAETDRRAASKIDSVEISHRKSVLNTWKKDCSSITIGKSVEIQGGEKADLVKDDDDEGAE